MSDVLGEMKEAGFAEFRRKVRTAEVLSAAVERLLSEIRFNSKVNVIVQKRHEVSPEEPGARSKNKFQRPIP